jgi:hypothetical protein
LTVTKQIEHLLAFACLWLIDKRGSGALEVLLLETSEESMLEQIQ